MALNNGASLVVVLEKARVRAIGIEQGERTKEPCWCANPWDITSESDAVAAGFEMEKLMDNSKNTYKYYVLKVGDRVVYRGVTNDLDRRGAEHRVRWPDGQVQPMGDETTMKKALSQMRNDAKSHEKPATS